LEGVKKFANLIIEGLELVVVDLPGVDGNKESDMKFEALICPFITKEINQNLGLNLFNSV
jgi:hypothetical protein